ncbi:biliverdin-producing heme oxygenase [Streptomyces sp. NPDC005438]|uniref:biliverdin-producing heme oxygenase n=1 Tax=Streptomyces sp. NPDC005438 TaxID=3156880 RepID=UPI0033A5F92F
MNPQPFATMLRDASKEQHSAATRAPFISELAAGTLSLSSYTRYTEQLWCVYTALERPWERLAADPVAGPFLRPELRRLEALERDLDHLHQGDHWRDTVRPLPATEAYAARVTEVAERWPGGYVAHHYTRYLGDLSGGQVIRGTAERVWGFASKGDGVRFYVFDGIRNPAAFKREYRALLDALPVDECERQRIVDECLHAFRLNTGLFRELSEELPMSA